MNILIQPLQTSDVNNLKPMIEELANFHNLLNEQFSTFYPVIDIDETIEQIKNGIEKNTILVLTAYKEKNLLGFIEIAFFEHMAKINRLFVDIEYRNHSIGKQLMNEAINLIQAKSIDYIDLTVVKENQQAKKFYESFAFEERAILMTKKLK
ncbi:GNAT family N-acetyltransferase [Enterococcus sp. LJL99]